MPSFADILNDKNRPDDQTITIDDAQVTLGELRKGAMLQADYTRKTMSLSEERKKLERDRSEWDVARIEAESKLAEFVKEALNANPATTVDEVQEMINRDPVASKLSNEVAETRKQHTELMTAIKELKAEQDRTKLQRFEDQHRQVLRTLKEQDPELNEQELIDFAKAHYTPRLDVAYKAMTFDKRMNDAVKSAKEEGMKAGIEQGKREASQPLLTQRRVIVPPTDTTPKNFEEATFAATQDPEILAIMRGTA